jgi:hypothetical protein
MPRRNQTNLGVENALLPGVVAASSSDTFGADQPFGCGILPPVCHSVKRRLQQFRPVSLISRNFNADNRHP